MALAVSFGVLAAPPVAAQPPCAWDTCGVAPLQPAVQVASSDAQVAALCGDSFEDVWSVCQRHGYEECAARVGELSPELAHGIRVATAHLGPGLWERPRPAPEPGPDGATLEGFWRFVSRCGNGADCVRATDRAPRALALGHALRDRSRMPARAAAARCLAPPEPAPSGAEASRVLARRVVACVDRARRADHPSLLLALQPHGGATCRPAAACARRACRRDEPRAGARARLEGLVGLLQERMTGPAQVRECSREDPLACTDAPLEVRVRYAKHAADVARLVAPHLALEQLWPTAEEVLARPGVISPDDAFQLWGLVYEAASWAGDGERLLLAAQRRERGPFGSVEEELRAIRQHIDALDAVGAHGEQHALFDRMSALVRRPEGRRYRAWLELARGRDAARHGARERALGHYRAALNIAGRAREACEDSGHPTTSSVRQRAQLLLAADAMERASASEAQRIGRALVPLVEHLDEACDETIAFEIAAVVRLAAERVAALGPAAAIRLLLDVETGFQRVEARISPAGSGSAPPPSLPTSPRTRALAGATGLARTLVTAARLRLVVRLGHREASLDLARAMLRDAEAALAWRPRTRRAQREQLAALGVQEDALLAAVGRFGGRPLLELALRAAFARRLAPGEPAVLPSGTLLYRAPVATDGWDREALAGYFAPPAPGARCGPPGAESASFARCLSDRELDAYLYVVQVQIDGEARYDAILVDREARITRVPLGPTDMLDPLAESLGRELARPDGRFLAHARRLHDLLWAPVTATFRSRVRRVAITLDGRLHQVPLHVLHDGQQYLVDRYDVIARVPGPGSLLPPVVSYDEGSVSVFADPAFEGRSSAMVNARRERAAAGASFPRLPGTMREARLIGLVAEDFVLRTGALATEAELFAQARDAHVLHLATHGGYEPDLQDAEGESFLVMVVPS